MKILTFFTFCMPALLWAQSPSIFDIKKNIAMSPTDPVYRDLYISGGTAAGLKKDMVLTVIRKNPLFDSLQNRTAGEIQVPVARIKIIYAQKDLAVGRFFGSPEEEERPMLEYDDVMIGDTLDLGSASMDKKPKKVSALGVIPVPNAVETSPEPMNREKNLETMPQKEAQPNQENSRMPAVEVVEQT